MNNPTSSPPVDPLSVLTSEERRCVRDVRAAVDDNGEYTPAELIMSVALARLAAENADLRKELNRG